MAKTIDILLKPMHPDYVNPVSKSNKTPYVTK